MQCRWGIEHGSHGTQDVVVFCCWIVCSATQLLRKTTEELDICLYILALERVKAGGLAAFQYHIGTAVDSDRSFSATVFIEEKDCGSGVVSLCLTEEEADKDCFTYTGLTNSHSIDNGFFSFRALAFEGCVEAGAVGLAIGRLKSSSALPP